MAEPAVIYYSIEEYLSMERKGSVRHEYYKGEVFAMSGASLRHNQIQMNFTREVGNHLKNKECTVFGSDLRVHIPFNTLFTYPDAVIVCGPPQLLDKEADTLLNPTVIIEILSKSPQLYDRGDKFNLYRSIPTLKEYLLIGSDFMSVEHYSKQDDETWLLKEQKNKKDEITISSIQFSLPMSDLYSGIVF